MAGPSTSAQPSPLPLSLLFSSLSSLIPSSLSVFLFGNLALASPPVVVVISLPLLPSQILSLSSLLPLFDASQLQPLLFLRRSSRSPSPLLRPRLSLFLSISFSIFLSPPQRISLSISLSFFLLKTKWSKNNRPTGSGPMVACTSHSASEGAEVGRPRFLGCPMTIVSRDRTAMKRHSLTTPTTGSWYQKVHLNLLFKMVPYVSDESARIVSTYFRAKMKILQVDPSQTEPYFEVTISNSYSWKKKCFPPVYNFPMFEVV